MYNFYLHSRYLKNNRNPIWTLSQAARFAMMMSFIQAKMFIHGWEFYFSVI